MQTNVLIVKETIETSQVVSTVIIDEDTDLLVLSIHYFDNNLCDKFLCPESKKSSKTVRSYDIRKMKVILNDATSSYILFAHGFLGYDTTSKPFGVGKRDCITLLMKSETF